MNKREQATPASQNPKWNGTKKHFFWQQHKKVFSQSPLLPAPDGPKAVCPTCGRVFFSREFRHKDNTSQKTKFCSMECYYEYLRSLGNSKNPFVMQANGKNSLSPDRQHMQQLLGRLLDKNEFVYRIGSKPDDIRVMSQSDIGKLTNNANNKFKVVEDGNYKAHVELTESGPMIGTCPVCGNKFSKRTQAQTFCSRSCASTAKVHKKG